MSPATTKIGAEAHAAAQKVFERWRDAVTEAHMTKQSMAAVSAMAEESRAHSAAMTDAVERLEAERDAALARAKNSEKYFCALKLQCETSGIVPPDVHKK
jgi:hypothetical protein